MILPRQKSMIVALYYPGLLHILITCHKKKQVLKCCVPQGSVFGRLLYCDYTIHVWTIRRHLLLYSIFTLYVNDSQIWMKTNAASKLSL